MHWVWRGLIVPGLVLTLPGGGAGQVLPRQAERGTVGGEGGQGVYVEAIEGDTTTALHWAAHRDDVEGVELLIRAGADVNATNELGVTPLWAASENGSAEVVGRLLAAGANPNVALPRGETPLMIASRSGDAAVIELLLKYSADPDATGMRGQTALMWAAARRNADVVKLLLEHGADFTTRSETWGMLMAQAPHPHPQHQGWFEHGGNTALLFAAAVGDVASVRHLLAAGADVNDRTAWGLSALTVAVYSQFGPLITTGGRLASIGGVYLGYGEEEALPGELYEEVVELLLEQGADPNLGGSRFTALHAAIMRRAERTVDLLLEHGANPNIPLGAWTPVTRSSPTDYYFHRAWVGALPTWLAARFGTPYILRRLVEHGGDPRRMHRGEHYLGSPNGEPGVRWGEQSALQREVSTPLMAAVGMSGTGRAWVFQMPDDREAEIAEKVRLLLSFGVDVNAVDHEGFRALDGARSTGYTSVVEVLLEAGAMDWRELEGEEARESGEDRGDAHH